MLYDVVKEFENKIAEYTGAKYAIAVDSCSNALFLCCKYLNVKTVFVPKKTYISVPFSIKNAGGNVKFIDLNWNRCYTLYPYPIYDSAIYIKRNLIPESFAKSGDYFICLSFHYKKILPIGRGGMILTNNLDAVNWFKKARFNGRNECDLINDNVDMIGWNFYMTPEQAARGLYLLQFLPDEPIIYKEEYPDLSKMKVFNNGM